MSTYFFKTNIDDTGTAVHIKPHLDRLEQSHEIEHWKVHLQDPDHVLEVKSTKMSPEQIRSYLEDRGVMAEESAAPKGKSHRSSS